MSPGINDHGRNTGTLPKSNRRIDRTRERDRSTLNHASNWMNRPSRTPAQHPNNLFQLDWHSVSDRRPQPHQASRTQAKNSNTSRSAYAAAHPVASSTSSASRTPSYELADIAGYNSHSRPYYSTNTHNYEDIPCTQPSWYKMTPPLDARTQSPPNLPANKPTNTDKMPERSQVEGRLNQIREYIKVTSTMMESLSHSSDPRAQAQHEKLGSMVEDLYDSEQKLSKLMDDCQKYWKTNENGELETETNQREQELRKKVEESERKLAQLQEHQANLVGMQLQMRERLNEARQAQALLDAEEQENGGEVEIVEINDERVQQQQPPTAGNVEQLERETEELRGKLMQLENKKRHMDQLVQELQAVEMSERASCSSEGSRAAPGQRDKVAELEAMKAQLKHLKALMSEATRCEELSADDANDDEQANGEVYQPGEENGASTSYLNSFNDAEESVVMLKGGSSDPPNVEQILAVTRELKEQQQLLITARAELRRLKQGPSVANPAPSLTSSTPPPMLVEKKQSNNDAQIKRRQLEDFMRKDQSEGQAMNQNGARDWSSRRGSNSQHSHTSTPGNIWPPPSAHNPTSGRSHEHSVDGMTTAENLMEMGSQAALEAGYGPNFWSMPALMASQPMQGAAAAAVGSAEYYKQLLLGSQAQQLQMMSTTIQQCCQLLWAQQREMQSMKAAIAQLQAQVRVNQSRANHNNLELQEDQHSNLRAAAAQQHYTLLDAASLPPSSSLPNLVSLPGASPHPVISTTVNCQQQQQPLQLNNQVPPGNRANNYWDNFRSYSRQNLLSGSSKTVTDSASSSTAHAVLPTNTANGVTIGSHVNNKYNRQPCLENLPTAQSCPDSQYSLNLQPPTRHQQQHQQHHHQHQLQPDRDTTSVLRNNYIPSNDASPEQFNQQLSQQQMMSQHQQQVDNVTVGNSTGAYRRQTRRKDDESFVRIAKKIAERDDFKLILMHCLAVLESRPQNESPLPSSNVSNSSESSDDESEAGMQGNSTLASVEKVVSSGNQLSTLQNVEAAASASQPCNSSATQYFSDHVEMPDSYYFDNTAHSLASITSSTPCNNGSFAEADQNRFDLSSNSVQILNNETSVKSESENTCHDDEAGATANCTLDTAEVSLDELTIDDEQDRVEYVMLDRTQNSPTTNQYLEHQQPEQVRCDEDEWATQSKCSDSMGVSKIKQ